MRPEAKKRVMILRLSAVPGSDDSMETANGRISSRSRTDLHAEDSAR